MNLWDAAVKDWYEALPAERCYEQTINGETIVSVMLTTDQIAGLVNRVGRVFGLEPGHDVREITRHLPGNPARASAVDRG